jgi:hypothetical protein
MSNNRGKNKPVFPHVDPKAGNFRSEIAKEFGLKAPIGSEASDKGISKNVRMSVESQMTGLPIYIKKGNDDAE